MKKKKQQKRKQTTKNKQQKSLFKIFIIIIISLLTITLILILIETNAISILQKKEVQKISIIDDCSVMFNNILHQIKTTDACQTMCHNECEIRNLKYKNSEFILSNTSCHTCDCYCI